jgi:hypothetical protein
MFENLWKLFFLRFSKSLHANSNFEFKIRPCIPSILSNLFPFFYLPSMQTDQGREGDLLGSLSGFPGSRRNFLLVGFHLDRRREREPEAIPRC